MRKLVLFLSLMTYSLCSIADIESLNAIVDRNPVMLDEAITLTVIAKGDAQREAFDSSVLLNDFIVGRTSVSNQTQIINFQSEQTTTWTTTLFPREVGNFTIPAFTIEGASTTPIDIQVIPVPSGQDQPARDFFVTAEVNQREIYLQQQLQYTVKVYLAAGIDRGSLQAPTMFQAQIQQIGEDKQYTDIQNGKRYQIIERTFAIVPQQSGDLTIRGPVFSGQVLAANTNNRFGMFNRTKPINRVGPDIDVTVLPIPNSVDYPWLPSEFVELTEEWQSDQFVVGEPVTRTLTLTAAGLVEEQLPSIEQRYPPQFKTYPDQANTAMVERDKKLISQRTESIAVIPTKAGKTILPEVTVPWFNVRTKQTEYATLPARQVDVLPASTSTTAAPPALPTALNADEPAPMADIQNVAPAQPIWLTIEGQILIAISVISTLGWLITLWSKKQRPTGPVNRPEILSSSTDESQLYKSLVASIKSGNTDLTYTHLYSWLIRGLACDLTHGQRLDSCNETQPLAPLVDTLLANRYSSSTQPWDKNALLRAIEQLRKSKQARARDNNKSLAPLYPTT